ncbi:hypothetical protein BH11PAT2_BH11PAT2_02170 [soil metagenome]
MTLPGQHLFSRPIILISLVPILLVVGLIAGYVYFHSRGNPVIPAATLLSADAYPLYPGAKWGVVATATKDSFVGHETVAEPVKNITNISSVSQPFENYYKQKLTASGWIVDNDFAAGGPGASITAYRKGAEYILTQLSTVFKAGGQNEPAQCPCDVTLSLFSGERNATPANSVSDDYKNSEYTIEGSPVRLVNGVAETETVPGSASKTVTRYFGNELRTDLNGDGKEDVVFLLTQSGGGSGTFYYVVAALATNNGYIGSDGYLLGDRIAPQTTEVSQNPRQKYVIVVNYADRGPHDPMSAIPSIGKSVYLKIDPATMRWGIVAPNFEGESK